MTMIDDFDAPNTKPGLCPVCGLRADIWNVHDATWECTYCSWSGRNTKQPVDNGNATKVK